MQIASANLQGLKLKQNRSDKILGELLTPHPEFDLIQKPSVHRLELESYVAKKFDEAYQANIHEFMPSLMGMRCLGHLSGVVGLRPACSGKLFLEQYLDSPIEEELKILFKQNVTRGNIVEIGNLAVSKSGASQILFLIFTAMLYSAGYKWLVFSATKPLLATFNKLGFKTQAIKQADPARLQTSSLNEWGSYYKSKPIVAVGSLKDAMAVIDQRPLFGKIKYLYQERIQSLAIEFGRGS